MRTQVELKKGVPRSARREFMRKIQPFELWVGNVGDVWDLRKVHERGIAALVDLALNEPPVPVTRGLAYCRFPLIDGSGNPTWLLQTAIETTARLISWRVPTLVYCSAGLSRSLLIAAAALALAEGGTLENRLASVTETGGADVSATLWQDVKEALASMSSDESN